MKDYEVRMAKKNLELKMVSPWVEYANSVRELFKLDPDVKKLTWSDEKLELHMQVADPLKAAAIRQLLPETKTFGKTVIKIFVEPTKNRRGGEKYVPELVKAAFTGNPLYVYQHEWNDPEATPNPYCWVVADKRVIQYPDDNLGDLYGDRSVLPEQLFREVLDTDYMFYCTQNPDRPIPDEKKKFKHPAMPKPAKAKKATAKAKDKVKEKAVEVVEEVADKAKSKKK